MTLTFNEFLEIVKGLGIKPGNSYNNRYEYSRNKNDKQPQHHYIYVYWMSGGVGGGSCWDDGDSNHYSIEGSPPEELKDLDRILEKICPTISFLQYKNLCADVVEVFTDSVNEYYGNSTNYAGKQVQLERLFDALVARGLIGN